MIKVEYKGYRIWAILQTSGRYRAWFFTSLVSDMSRGIEGDTEAEAIDKATKFIDASRLHKTPHRSAIADQWAV
jgi:hypothetical protein